MTYRVMRELPLNAKISLLKRTVRQVLPSASNKSAPKMSPRAVWEGMDAVDMETIERTHFLTTGKVFRPSFVQAREVSLEFPARLGQVLGLQFLEDIDSMSVHDFVTILQTAFIVAPPNAFFHRDLTVDGQFSVCKKFLTMSTEDIGIYILPISLVLNKFDPALEIVKRVWSREIVPAVRRGLAKTDNVPPSMARLSQGDRWAVLTSQILLSGRVRPTNRLLGYLRESGSFETISDGEVYSELLDAILVSGCYIEPVLESGWRTVACKSPTVFAKAIHTILHFGWTTTKDTLTKLQAHLLTLTIDEISTVKKLSQCDQLLIWNALSEESEIPTVIREWGNSLIARIAT